MRLLRAAQSGAITAEIDLRQRGTGVASVLSMLPEPEFHDELPERETQLPEDDDATVHRFTVQRGMAVALVIETRDWYSGLLQAAMARVRIEGHN